MYICVVAVCTPAPPPPSPNGLGGWLIGTNCTKSYEINLFSMIFSWNSVKIHWFAVLMDAHGRSASVSIENQWIFNDFLLISTGSTGGGGGLTDAHGRWASVSVREYWKSIIFHWFSIEIHWASIDLQYSRTLTDAQRPWTLKINGFSWFVINFNSFHRGGGAHGRLHIDFQWFWWIFNEFHTFISINVWTQPIGGVPVYPPYIYIYIKMYR